LALGNLPFFHRLGYFFPWLFDIGRPLLSRILFSLPLGFSSLTPLPPFHNLLFSLPLLFCFLFFLMDKGYFQSGSIVFSRSSPFGGEDGLVHFNSSPSLIIAVQVEFDCAGVPKGLFRPVCVPRLTQRPLPRFSFPPPSLPSPLPGSFLSCSTLHAAALRLPPGQPCASYLGRFSSISPFPTRSSCEPQLFFSGTRNVRVMEVALFGISFSEVMDCLSCSRFFSRDSLCSSNGAAALAEV